MNRLAEKEVVHVRASAVSGLPENLQRNAQFVAVVGGAALAAIVLVVLLYWVLHSKNRRYRRSLLTQKLPIRKDSSSRRPSIYALPIAKPQPWDIYRTQRVKHPSCPSSCNNNNVGIHSRTPTPTPPGSRTSSPIPPLKQTPVQFIVIGDEHNNNAEKESPLSKWKLVTRQSSGESEEF